MGTSYEQLVTPSRIHIPLQNQHQDISTALLMALVLVSGGLPQVRKSWVLQVKKSSRNELNPWTSISEVRKPGELGTAEACGAHSHGQRGKALPLDLRVGTVTSTVHTRGFRLGRTTMKGHITDLTAQENSACTEGLHFHTFQ